MLPFVAALGWLVAGQAVAVLMRWRGHGPAWHVWGVVLGPLLSFVAAEQRPNSVVEERGVLPGRPGCGDLDVLVVATADADATTAALRSVATGRSPRLGRVTVTSVVPFDEVLAWEPAPSTEEAALRRARIAELEHPLRDAVDSCRGLGDLDIEPDAVLLFGRPGPAIAQFALTNGYDEVLVVGDEPLDRGLSRALRDRLVPHASVSVT